MLVAGINNGQFRSDDTKEISLYTPHQRSEFELCVLPAVEIDLFSTHGLDFRLLLRIKTSSLPSDWTSVCCYQGTVDKSSCLSGVRIPLLAGSAVDTFLFLSD